MHVYYLPFLPTTQEPILLARSQAMAKLCTPLLFLPEHMPVVVVIPGVTMRQDPMMSPSLPESLRVSSLVACNHWWCRMKPVQAVRQCTLHWPDQQIIKVS